MKLKIAHILFFALCCYFSLNFYGQEVFPPPPDGSTYMSHETDPCGNVLEHDDGEEGPLPPPPGLCLPINDYLIPLLIAGIILGIYQVHRFEKA